MPTFKAMNILGFLRQIFRFEIAYVKNTDIGKIC